MKMKRKTMFCMLSLCLLSAASVTAQVTIGGNTDAPAGALLDLNSPGGTRGGLVLSNIAIDDLGKIPANKLWGISIEQDTKEELRGIMVYNTGTPGVPAGIYVWNGYCWSPDGSCTPIIIPSPSPAFAVFSSDGYADLAITADGCPPLIYTWYEHTAPSTTGGTPIEGLDPDITTYQTPTGLEEGTHYYYCTVESPSSNVVATSDLFTVTVCLLPSQPGTISKSGSASVQSGSSQTYSVEAVDGATSYEWILPSGWNITDGEDSRSITVTVGTLGGNIGVKATNSCGSSDTQTLAVTVIPACSGAIVFNGAYNGPSAGTYTTGLNSSFSANWSNGVFTAQHKDLCWTATDISGISNWATAVAACAALTTDGASWRLPNLKELQFLYEALGGTGGSATNFTNLGAKGTANSATSMQSGLYWSSTEYSRDLAYLFTFNNGNRLTGNKTVINYYVRCVRSL
jgi:hypothetical protein